MNLVDSCGWLKYFADGPHADFYVAALALKAARVSRDLKLPLADSVILATASAYLAVIWTQDAHFKGLQGVRHTEKVMSGAQCASYN